MPVRRIQVDPATISKRIEWHGVAHTLLRFDWQPEIRNLARNHTQKTLRRDADNRHRSSIDSYCSTDHRRICSEVLSPIPVAKYRGPCAADRQCIAIEQEAPTHRSEPKS